MRSQGKRQQKAKSQGGAEGDQTDYRKQAHTTARGTGTQNTSTKRLGRRKQVCKVLLRSSKELRVKANSA